jgi:hypothetical protein
LPDVHEAVPLALHKEQEKREAVLRELDRILTSTFFRSASRSKQFLQYVVLHQLDGHTEALKERTIGTEVFLRPPGYATGDDPVVRVQAGEVRRRLEQFYQAAPEPSSVHIELPVGSYSPVFHWPGEMPVHEPARYPAPEPALEKRPHPGKLFWVLTSVILLCAVAASLYWLSMRRAEREKSTLEQFWAPVFTSQQPVLICLAKPVVYRPSQELYRRYARSHPGAFDTEVERDNEPLPLGENETISWGELYIASDFGVALGDAQAAISLSGLLGKIDKPSQVRIGDNYSFEDLRYSPAVVVGAFNNKWTVPLTSNLQFTFVEDHEDFSIREAAPGNRIWHVRTGPHGQVVEDYAIVSRLINSKTGQFTITVAGITGAGTQAAGEFVSNAKYLEQSLRNAPEGWQKRNLELVLETTVTDSVAGPPHVVAAYWGGANN